MSATMLQMAAARFQERLEAYAQTHYGQNLDHGLETIALTQELLAPMTSLNRFEPPFYEDLMHVMDAGAYLSLLLTHAWIEMGLEPIELEEDAQEHMELRLCRSPFLNKNPECDITLTVYPILMKRDAETAYVQMPGLDLLDILLTPYNPMPSFAAQYLPLTPYFDVIENYFLGALLLNSPFAIGNWRHKYAEIDPRILEKGLAWVSKRYLNVIEKNEKRLGKAFADEERALLKKALNSSLWPADFTKGHSPTPVHFEAEEQEKINGWIKRSGRRSLRQLLRGQNG